MIAPIVTERLTLESPPPLDLVDLHQMVLWLNTPDVVRYSEQRHKIHSMSNQSEYIESFLWPSQFRIIRLNGKMIGTITAHVDTSNSVADMGIMIGDQTMWRKGYGTEAWIGLMMHLFNIGIYKIEAGCMTPNNGMIHIFSKSNMRREGCRDSHFKFENGRIDLEQWAIP